MPISSNEFAIMESRLRAKIGARRESPTNPVDKESDLHDAIEMELCRRRWYYVHSRMDRASTQQKGVPDFIIAAADGKSYWIECKAKGKKQTPEQRAAALVLHMNGHRHAVVYSFAEFLEAIK